MRPIDQLIALHKSKYTGAVTFVENSIDRAFIFKNGEITYIESNLREETLGALLLAEQKITPEQQIESINRMMETKKLHGETLIELGILSPTEAFDAINRQVRLKLVNSMRMQSVEVKKSLQVPENLPVFQIPFFETILDGLMENYSPQRYENESEFSEDDVIRLNEAFEMYKKNVNIPVKLMREFRAMNQNSIAAILRASQDRKTCTALVFLLSKMGFVDVLASAQAAPSQTKPNAVPVKKKAKPAVSPYADVKQSSKEQENNLPLPEKMVAFLLRARKLSFFEMLNCMHGAAQLAVQKGYQDRIKEFSMNEIDKKYEGDQIVQAEQLFDLLSHAFTVLSNSNMRQDYIQRLEETQKVGETDEPDNNLRAEIELNKARTCMKFGNFAKAKDCAQKACEYSPKDPVYRVTVAQVQLKIDMKAENKPSSQVLDYLKEAADIDPNYADTYFEMGLYYKLIEDFDNAKRYFQRTLDIKPKSPAADTELRLIENRKSKSKKSLFSGFRSKN